MDDALLDRHSTLVRLTFTVDGTSYDVAQVGPDFLIFRDAVELPACAGQLSIVIDETERLRTVELVDGAQPTKRTTRTRMVDLDI